MCEFITKADKSSSRRGASRSLGAAVLARTKHRLCARSQYLLSPPQSPLRQTARQDTQPPGHTARHSRLPGTGHLLPLQQTALAPGTKGHPSGGYYSLPVPGTPCAVKSSGPHPPPRTVPPLPCFCKSILMFAACTRLMKGSLA